MPKAKRKLKPVEKVLLKLDLGCGQNKRQGFTGVDIVAMEGVDVVHDLFTFPWPFERESVEEVWCSHFFEHVPGKLRGTWMDELWRILIPGGRATLIFPYYSSTRSIQDFTHEWPPLCEASFLYFNREWRKQNRLDHYPVTCDFDFTYGYDMAMDWAQRHEEVRADAIRRSLNVVLDMHIVLMKKT